MKVIKSEEAVKWRNGSTCTQASLFEAGVTMAASCKAKTKIMSKIVT